MIGFCLIFLSSICSFFFFFFFFKQKTAYEILIVTGVQTCALPICVRHGTSDLDRNTNKTYAIVGKADSWPDRAYRAPPQPMRRRQVPAVHGRGDPTARCTEPGLRVALPPSGALLRSNGEQESQPMRRGRRWRNSFRLPRQGAWKPDSR